MGWWGRRAARRRCCGCTTRRLAPLKHEWLDTDMATRKGEGDDYNEAVPALGLLGWISSFSDLECFYLSVEI